MPSHPLQDQAKSSLYQVASKPTLYMDRCTMRTCGRTGRKAFFVFVHVHRGSILLSI